MSNIINNRDSRLIQKSLLDKCIAPRADFDKAKKFGVQHEITNEDGYIEAYKLNGHIYVTKIKPQPNNHAVTGAFSLVMGVRARTITKVNVPVERLVI